MLLACALELDERLLPGPDGLSDLHELSLAAGEPFTRLDEHLFATLLGALKLFHLLTQHARALLNSGPRDFLLGHRLIELLMLLPQRHEFCFALGDSDFQLPCHTVHQLAISSAFLDFLACGCQPIGDGACNSL
jgi:hypothetical protein